MRTTMNRQLWKNEMKMKKEKKIVEQAKKAKALGYTYISSVVKRFGYTTYYHINSVDSIIEACHWIPAPIKTMGWRGRIGIRESQFPIGMIISKQKLYQL